MTTTAFCDERVTQGGTTFVPLLAEAVSQGRQAEFIDLLYWASAFHPSLRAPSNESGLPPIVPLADGAKSPSLFLIPSAISISGPQEYFRLAASFEGERAVAAVSLPGFSAGEPLPTSVEVAARCQAEAIVEHGPGRDFAIVGHSSGGWLAHAVVAELERMGRAPNALVLLDVYHPGRDLIDRIIPKVTGLLHHATNDRGLLAMAGYMRMFKAWQPTEISTPTTMVRASDSLVENVFDFDSVSYLSWQPPHRSMRVRGNHFTMVQDYASTTAEAVRLAIHGGMRGVAECAGRRRSLTTGAAV